MGVDLRSKLKSNHTDPLQMYSGYIPQHMMGVSSFDVTRGKISGTALNALKKS